VLAFDPSTSELVHIETSGDMNSWRERESRARKRKFILSLEEYEDILGTSIASVKKVAIVGFSKRTKEPLD
jgi:hypothetical protein